MAQTQHSHHKPQLTVSWSLMLFWRSYYLKWMDEEVQQVSSSNKAVPAGVQLPWILWAAMWLASSFRRPRDFELDR
eukprot:scaffold2432_cov63-Cyclotella_meneghiniana.AAC.6